MPFPADRFARAGASVEKIAELQADYEQLTAAAQAGYDARIAPLSDQGVAALLSEPVQEIEDAPEPEVFAPTGDVQSSSKSSVSSSSPSGSDSEK